MKYIELFAGIGGFRLGIERSVQKGLREEQSLYEQQRTSKPNSKNRLNSENTGFTCVYTNEWDKYAAQIYEKRFNTKVDTRDITTVPTDDIPDHDLLCGGFPCQSFSVAGKRGGFNDIRGTMFFEIARILKDKRPRYLLLENVKGLLSHDSGKTFQTILRVLTELGYDCQWQVLNSKNFGVPQNRERVFIIGHLRGEPRPKVFPIGENNSKNGRVDEQGGTSEDQIASTLTVEYAKNQHGNQYVAEMLELTQGVSDAQRIYDPKGIAKTLKGLGGGMGAKTGLYAVPLKFQQRNQRNYQGAYSFTVDSVNTGGIMLNASVRRLTPVECERLQAFSDNFTKYGIDEKGNEVEISDSQRYKCLGNAVTTNVVQAIMERLMVDSPKK